MKEITIKVEDNNDLVKYLSNKGYAKNKIKTYIKLGFIYLNNKQINKLPISINKDDIIIIRKEQIINTKLT